MAHQHFSKFACFRFFLAGLVLMLITSCDKGPGKLEDIVQGSVHVDLNPYEKVPLGALVKFRTKEKCRVKVTVTGSVPVTKEFSTLSDRHSLPVLGLYPDTTNLINIVLTTEDGKIYNGSAEVTTSAIPDFFPAIEIEKIDRSLMEPGFHLIEMLIANDGRFHAYTIMFDDNGDIRWYMDMSGVGQISYTPLRLANGNWLYLSWIDIWELSDLGEEIKKEQMWLYAGNHDIVELPNNRLLMAGSKKDSKVRRSDGHEVVTRYDYVVEWDRSANRGIREWDLAEVLDIDRSVYPEDYNLDFRVDWLHINNVTRSVADNSIIISGRNQGVAKVDNENNLMWILAPHQGWGKAGRTGAGFETSDYLLTALDADGNALPAAVQQGFAGADDFEWSTGQHAVTILENGNILMFDNGLSRNFGRKPTYSRAVEYRIDEENMTIRQVWEYGTSRGLDMYAPITSDVDVLPVTGNRLITAGNIRASELPPHAKVIEITYPDNKEIFEARIFFKDATSTGENAWGQLDVVYRGERYDLYGR